MSSGNTGCKLLVIDEQAVSVEGSTLVAAPINVRDHQKQHFSVVSQPDGSIIILHRALNKVLDVTGNSTATGTLVCLWNEHKGDNQRWTVTPEGYVQSKLSSPVYLGFAQGKLVITNQPAVVTFIDGIETVKVTLVNNSSDRIDVEVALTDETTTTIQLPPLPSPAQEVFLDIGAVLTPDSVPYGSYIIPETATVTDSSPTTFSFIAVTMYRVNLQNQTLWPLTVIVTASYPGMADDVQEIRFLDIKRLSLPYGSTIVLQPSEFVVTPETTTVTKAQTIMFTSPTLPPVNVVLRNTTAASITVNSNENPAKLLKIPAGSEVTASCVIGALLFTSTVVAPTYKRVKKAETIIYSTGLGGNLTSTERYYIISWLPNKQFTLLYRATIDGQHASQFHSKVDDKGPCICVVTTPQNYKFGGYAADGFQSQTNHQFSGNTASFGFSLVSPTNPNESKQFKPDLALANPKYTEKRVYISKGNNHIYFSNFFIIHNVGGSGVPLANEEGSIMPNIGFKFLTGDTQFNVSEVEVYQVSDISTV